MYFLRFTNTPDEDLIRGTSLLDLPSLEEPKELEGLCGFRIFDDEEIEYGIISDEEIKSKIRMYRQNLHYKGIPVIFKGEYIGQNPNGEGHVFEPNSIYKQF